MEETEKEKQQMQRKKAEKKGYHLHSPSKKEMQSHTGNESSVESSL